LPRFCLLKCSGACHQCPFHHSWNDRPSVWVNVYGTLTIRDFQMCVLITIGLELSMVRNSVVTLCLACMSTTSAILHCWRTDCSTHDLLLLNGVAIQCIRQETLSSTTFRREEIGGITCVLILYNTY
jgi:hypothetical protein